MFEFAFNFFEFLNFILILSIFSTSSLIVINSNDKYDVVASTLFLNRKKLKYPILAGYFGIILLFAGKFLFTLNVGIISELMLQLILISGLFFILFLIYRVHNAIYTSMKFNAEIQKKK